MADDHAGLVGRLRRVSSNSRPSTLSACREAADAIESLTARATAAEARAQAVEGERDAARAALKPFAEASCHLHPSHPDDGVTLDGIEVRHWRQAWSALTPAGGTDR